MLQSLQDGHLLFESNLLCLVVAILLMVEGGRDKGRKEGRKEGGGGGEYHLSEPCA